VPAPDLGREIHLRGWQRTEGAVEVGPTGARVLVHPRVGQGQERLALGGEVVTVPRLGERHASGRVGRRQVGPVVVEAREAEAGVGGVRVAATSRRADQAEIQAHRRGVVVRQAGRGRQAQEGGAVGGVGTQPRRPARQERRSAVALDREHRLTDVPAGDVAGGVGRYAGR
jgi:hypothetical protein